MAGSRSIYKMGKLDKKCKGMDHAKVMSVKEIVVSSMKMPTDYWQKAPRRQCCEILDQGRIKDGGLRIRIRKCRN